MKSIEVPFGFEKDGKLYLSGWSSHNDREIGEVRDGDLEKSIAFFTNRFDDLEKKVQEVATKIDSTENKGSFLMKLLHLKEQLPVHDGLGNYSKLLEVIERYEALVKDIIQKNRERNTEIKSALIEEAKQIEEIINWKEATEKVNDLKARWIKTGNAEEEKNEELEQAFWAIIQDFFEKKKNFYEDKQKLIEVRKRKYEELVNKAEKASKLYGREKGTKAKELREAWKEVGGVPKEIFEPLISKFNDYLKNNSPAQKTDYSQIIASLELVKKGEVPFDKKTLDQIKQNTYRDKGRNPDKGKVLELVQLLVEREFVIKLSKKRFSDFDSLGADKKKSIRKSIIRDLISRDEEDLKIYEENSANFSSADGSMNKMVESKLKGQRRKIEVKTKLLEWLENEEF